MMRLLACTASRPVAAAALLVLLCVATYLPGVLRLPAVDRTEIVFAETTREMVARGVWLDPRYGETVHQLHPIGAYLAQGAIARLAGPIYARDIRIYRIPSVVAVTLSVVALFWMLMPVAGSTTAAMAAGLFAVAPLTVLVSQLAIADGLALLPATVAMLALLRLYVCGSSSTPPALAPVFWTALGIAMLVNALQTPILVAVTLVTLYALDRDLAWLRRLRVLHGLPIALLLGSPWLVVRVLQDGLPFAGLSTSAVIDALAGSQSMKLSATSGTFLLAIGLGFLPGIALLPDALKQLWDRRNDRLSRFLLAWIVGYLLLLEGLSSKPATYTVQVMFPALAIAVAVLIAGTSPRSEVPRWSLIPHPVLAALIALALLSTPYAFAITWPSPLAIAMSAVVAAMLAWTAVAGRARDFRRWVGLATLSLALFAVAALGIVLPSIRQLWPAAEIARAAGNCASGPIWVLGMREPSTVFLFDADKDTAPPATMPDLGHSIHAIESRWIERHRAAMSERGIAPVEFACIEGYNTVRNCRVTFTLIASAATAQRCRQPPDLAASCRTVKQQIRPPDACE